MVVNGRPLKRMKRRVTADLYDFLTFPSAGDEFSCGLDGPFRSNVRSFLSKYARMPSLFTPAVFPHLLTWQITFRVGEFNGQDATQAAIVALDVVEEDVSRSRSVYCDQCRVVGWSGHPVCGKRYHFIIRTDSISADGYHQPCTRCGVLLHSLDMRCKSCNYQITSDDLEDWLYLQLTNTTHLLHGVVHANGYGHLLRINGREGGSKFLSGRHIMDFWDRLCKMLGVRKISVMDVSKKYGLDYRLLHAVTSNRPWYGDWGYEFGAGSFGLTAEAYQQAVKCLSNMPLAPLFTHRRTRTHLQDVVAFYMSLSENLLSTVRDLFRFIMGLLHNKHKQAAGTCCKKLGQVAAPMQRWGKDDIERVEHAMVRVLRAVGESCWISWRALRRAVCQAGPPGLLDYCLKEIGGKSLDGVAVHMRCNSETNVIEYRIKVGNGDAEDSVADEVLLSLNSLTEDHLCRDLKFLYYALLHPETMVCHKPQTIRVHATLSSAVKLLDCKQFVKVYVSDVVKSPNPFVLRVWCQVVFAKQPKDYIAPPPELLVLPASATVADLKQEAKKAFQEVYHVCKRLEVEQLLDFGDVGESTHVKLLIGLEGSVRVLGRCFVSHGVHRFRLERGIEKWTVDCICGAKDDDGERMLACDACGVWQHTRCSGIHAYEAVPAKFLCGRCEDSTKPSFIAGRFCKDQLDDATSNVGRAVNRYQ